MGPAAWEERAAPFLRAADMLEHGPWRDRLVAATMLELSKTWRQADGDAACETIDFIRANVKNMLAMYAVQPFRRRACGTTSSTARSRASSSRSPRSTSPP